MNVTRITLAEGVRLTYLPAQKFKTSILSAQFVTPLRRSTVSAYALFPDILRRGTLSCPDMGKLSRRLDTLYGARIDPVVRKIGERQCTGFAASFIDDAFVPGGERLLEPVAALLGELLFEPATEHGRFQTAWFESEKNNLLDAVRSAVNDKREWAARRLIEEMCRREPYGIPRLGSENCVERVGPVRLYRQYRELLASGQMELVYCGSAELSRVRDALSQMLATMGRGKVIDLPAMHAHTPRKAVRFVTDHMDVTQGKLGLGFSCTSDDTTALLVGNTLFGGSSNSRLFLNVREKLSLCYYASSVFHRYKRLITVASGIEFANFQRAYDEILAQLKAVQTGATESWELDAARAALLNAYASMGDSQGKLENFYLNQAVLNLEETPEILSARVRDITPERIIEAMNTVKLDTVYFLRDQDGAEQDKSQNT